MATLDLSSLSCLLRIKPFHRTPRQLEELAQCFTSAKGLLHGLDLQHARRLVKWIGYAHFVEDQQIFEQGQKDDILYLVLDGSCTVWQDNKEIPSAWLYPGDCFGELALLDAHKARGFSAVACGGDLHVGTLDRAAFNHLRLQSQAEPETASAIHALLAACCKRLLKVPLWQRCKHETEALEGLLGSLKAFKQLPAAMVGRICQEAAHVHLPPDSTLFEEDAAGHCMYVVLSGSCHIRARPLHTALHTCNASTSGAASTFQATVADVKSHRRAVQYGSSASTPAAFSGRATPSTAQPGSGPRSSSVSDSGAARVQDSVNDDTDDSDDERSLPKPAIQQSAASSSPFWIAKFMQQACKGLNVQDAANGLGEGVTPLTAVAAAKWRQLGQQAHQKDVETEAAPVSVMEDLLGRAAARALQQATHANTYSSYDLDDTPAHAPLLDSLEPDFSAPTTKDAESVDLQCPSTHANSSHIQAGDVTHKSAQLAAHAASNSIAGQHTAQTQRRSSTGVDQPTARGQHRRWTDSTFGDLDGSASTALTAVSSTGETANKRLLMKLGSMDPGNVSMQLLSEIAERADLSAVMYEMAKQLIRRGPPTKMSKKTAEAVSKVLSHKILTGASSRNTLLGRKLLRHGSSLAQQHESAAKLQQKMFAMMDADLDVQDAETGSLCSVSTRKSGKSRATEYFAGMHGSHADNVSVVAPWDATADSDHVPASQRDQVYGPIVRTVHFGESFGEMALLQRGAQRTATVMSSSDPAGVDLLCISCQCYDHTVQQVHMDQLQELLSFLSSLQPFKHLNREQLTGLAVFSRIRHIAKRQVLAKEGDVVDAVYIVQEGEICLMQPRSAGPPVLPKTSALRHAMRTHSGASAHEPASLTGQLRAKAMMRQLSLPAESGSRAHASWRQQDGASRRVMFEAGTQFQEDAAADASGPLSNHPDMVVLSVLGPGSILGQAATEKSSESLDAATSSTSVRHQATVVATKTCKLLCISVSDLQRFGSTVTDALADMQNARGTFLKTRTESIQAAHSAIIDKLEANKQLLKSVHQGHVLPSQVQQLEVQEAQAQLNAAESSYINGHSSASVPAAMVQQATFSRNASMKHSGSSRARGSSTGSSGLFFTLPPISGGSTVQPAKPENATPSLTGLLSRLDSVLSLGVPNVERKLVHLDSDPGPLRLPPLKDAGASPMFQRTISAQSYTFITSSKADQRPESPHQLDDKQAYMQSNTTDSSFSKQLSSKPQSPSSAKHDSLHLAPASPGNASQDDIFMSKADEASRSAEATGWERFTQLEYELRTRLAGKGDTEALAGLPRLPSAGVS